MLTSWDPERIRDRIPLVLAAVGARRCGKSTAISHLVYQMYDTFELVLAFVGSAACSPVLEAMMERHPKWDCRFFFSSWNQPVIDKLLEQQEYLKKKGIDRHVLILMDDVILTSKDEDQLAHMCLRGRHFNISCMMCAVSYTSICKRARRSFDFLLCYSCPMQGDMKILSWEYANNSSSAGFALNGLEENQCVVFETSRKRQKLYNWRAQLLVPDDFRRSTLPVLLKSERRLSRDSFSARRSSLHRKERSFPLDGTQSSGDRDVSQGTEEETPPPPSESSPRNDGADRPADSASSESRRNVSSDAATDCDH